MKLDKPSKNVHFVKGLRKNRNPIWNLLPEGVCCVDKCSPLAYYRCAFRANLSRTTLSRETRRFFYFIPFPFCNLHAKCIRPFNNTLFETAVTVLVFTFYKIINCTSNLFSFWPCVTNMYINHPFSTSNIT